MTHTQPFFDRLEARRRDVGTTLCVGIDPRLDRMPAEVTGGLARRGLDVHQADDWMPGWGPVSMIETDGATAAGFADPRVSTASATVP